MKPLSGRRVLITRRSEQSVELAAELEALGAEAVVVPAIEVVLPEDLGPLDSALSRLGDFDWLALTSANAVAFVAQQLRELGLSLPPALRLASVGPGTSTAMRAELGRGPDLEPESDYQAEALAELLAARGGAGARLLFPTSDRGRETLPRALEERGWRVEKVVAYRTRAVEGLGRALEAAGRLDVATFASPSAVTACVAARPALPGLPCAVIGPVTARTARDAGFAVVLIAEPSSVAGLVMAVRRLLAPKSLTPGD